MEGIPSDSEGSSKEEDLEVKDSLDTWNLKAPVMDLNVQFYQGKIASEPHGATVDEILSWHDDLPKLETYHGYIQWLFPTSQPSSSNRYAQPLQPEEAEAIQQDKTARNRFLRAYLMMLHFYGMTIVDYGTGKLAHIEHYKDRFVNLNNSTHNHIRITRILTSLGEMGLERYQFPLVKFLLVEAITSGRLLNAIPSARDFWIKAVKDASERNILQDYAVQLAKEAMDSNAPHATTGNTVCICQFCKALRELQKMAPDHKPKAQARSEQQIRVARGCDDPNCSKCRNKNVYVSTDRDHRAAERVVQIEDLSHLTSELGKISARLNVVTAERALQKTIETPEQIEELACLMDELKQVSIALGSVSTKLEALSLGERFIEKRERRKPTGQTVESSSLGETGSDVVKFIQDKTQGTERARADALGEESDKRAVRFNLDSPQTTLDPEREIDRANSPLTKQGFSSTAEGSSALKVVSTRKDGCRSGASLLTASTGYDKHQTEGSAADTSISAAKENHQLPNELLEKKTPHDKIPEPIEKDQIILMTERLFSSLEPPASAQSSLKNEQVSFTDAGLEGFDDLSENMWRMVRADGEDDSSFEKQRPLESLQASSRSDQNSRMPGRGKKLDRKVSGRGGRTDQDDLTKEIELDEDSELNDDNQAHHADDSQETEEPAWMQDFRQRSAQDKKA